jgi:isocitrate dehydrogenase (NAD+)
MTTDKPLRKLPATLIPGDGIGPEIVKSAVDILEALGSPFEWEIRQGGLAAIGESHDPLPSHRRSQGERPQSANRCVS